MNPTETSRLQQLLHRVFPPAPDFYRLIDEQCDLAVVAMEEFVAFMADSDPEKGLRVRELEHRCDDLKRRNMDILNRSFATPMDREDIYRAIRTIDDIVGYAKTTVREMEILRVKPDEPMQQMARLLLEGMQALQEGYAKLRKRPLDAESDAQRAHKAERQTEKVYRAAVAKLFDESRLHAMIENEGAKGVVAAITTVVAMLRHRELYRHLSNAADRVDIAAETLHNIIVKIA